MKVLFAVNREEISSQIVKKYQKEYKEIISFKNVYYFNAIIKELQRDKSYDRIVISEDLEPFANNNYDAIDKFLFDKLDNISDEATGNEGDIPIILICTERRSRSDAILIKLFGLGIYNALLGNDRSINNLCQLINKPRSKKDAKIYYKIESNDVNYQSEDENSVSEAEIQNIINYYKRLGKNEDKYVESFDKIASQYNDKQLKIIIKFLPLNVKAVLEGESAKYQSLITFSGESAIKKQSKIKEQGLEIGFLKQNKSNKLTKPVIVPTAVNTKSAKKLNVKKVEAISEPIRRTSKEQTITEPTRKANNIQPIIEPEVELLNEDFNDIETVEEPIKEIEMPKKRGRGRPKKIVEPSDMQNEPVQPKRGRGRPKKNPDVSMQEQIEKSNGILPGFEEEPAELNTLPGFDEQLDDGLNTLPGFEEDLDSGFDTLPGFDEESEKFNTMPKFDKQPNKKQNMRSELEDNHELPRFEEESLDDFSTLPGFEEESEDTFNTLPGFDNFETNNHLNTTNSNLNNRNSRTNDDFNINNRINDNQYINRKESYQNNLVNYNNYSNSNPYSINNISKDKKVVTFVGTTKNGTSFLVNNLAKCLSNMGIKTAILDLTQNRNSYYIYTNNEEKLRNIAYESIKKLNMGIANGIEVDRNLTIFTALPGDNVDLNNAQSIISTLLDKYSVVLIDADFNTPLEYFNISQEIYVVQTFDILTIQPMTAFMRDLKAKGILSTEKLRIVINKEVKVRGLTSKSIIGGLAFYNDPAMSFMTELFNKDTVKYCTIPFEYEVYSKYLESMLDCEVTLNGYSKNFMSKLKELANMVYPLINSNYRNLGNYANDKFSSDVNKTLQQMKNKY